MYKLVKVNKLMTEKSDDIDELLLNFKIPKEIGKLIFQYVGSLDPAAKLISELRKSFEMMRNALPYEMRDLMVKNEETMCTSIFDTRVIISPWCAWSINNKYHCEFEYCVNFNEAQEIQEEYLGMTPHSVTEYKHYFFYGI